MANKWAGIFPAVWTPTNAAGGLLREALRTNLEFLKRRGVHGFMALGSTGEFPLLEFATPKHALEEIIESAGTLPVIANISDLRSAQVTELGKLSKRLGAAAVAALPPYFYRLDQADLVEFFLRAADAAQLPLVLYNFPERTGVRLELETISEVASRVPLLAVKQSGEDFEYHLPLLELAQKEHFLVFTGADTRLDEALALGVGGSISGIANALPDFMVEIFSAFENGAPERADNAARRMRRLSALINRCWFPLNIAALMTARELPVGEPKFLLSAMTRERYSELVNECRRLFEEWEVD